MFQTTFLVTMDLILPSIMRAVPKLAQSITLEISIPPQITEAAIKKSQTFDGVPVVINMLMMQFRICPETKMMRAIEVVEYPDEEPPVILKSIIDYSNSLIVLECNEVMDGSRAHLANGTKLVVVKVSESELAYSVGSTVRTLRNSCTAF